MDARTSARSLRDSHAISFWSRAWLRGNTTCPCPMIVCCALHNVIAHLSVSEHPPAPCNAWTKVRTVAYLPTYTALSHYIAAHLREGFLLTPMHSVRGTPTGLFCLRPPSHPVPPCRLLISAGSPSGVSSAIAMLGILFHDFRSLSEL